MDSELSNFVHQAADIAISGRWARVNDRIEILAANPGPNNSWWIEIFASWASQNFGEYLSLKRSYENPQRDDAALLAWRARNLLELSVWSTYCAKTRENARVFYEDAGRDVREIYDAFLSWGSATNQGAEWIDPIASAKKELEHRVRHFVGVQSVDGPYKKVSEAAKICGLGLHFQTDWKLLSKFAHPTAMMILGQLDDMRAVQQRDLVFSKGCLFFLGAFHAIEDQICRHANCG